MVETYKKDPTLKAAYEKKRAVIEATQEAMVAPGQMSAIVDATRVELQELANQLASGQFADGGCASDAFSLADVQWGAVLYRLQWVGLQPLLWEKGSIISAYAEKLLRKRHFKQALFSGREWVARSSCRPFATSC